MESFTFEKTLVLRGARQVGKTYLLKAFAKKEYADNIYINFDEEPHFNRTTNLSS